jgi:hypothetical protein
VISILCYCFVETACIVTVALYCYCRPVLLLLPCITNVNVTVVSSADGEDCLDDLSKEYEEGNVKFCVFSYYKSVIVF